MEERARGAGQVLPLPRATARDHWHVLPPRPKAAAAEPPALTNQQAHVLLQLHAAQLREALLRQHGLEARNNLWAAGAERLGGGRVGAVRSWQEVGSLAGRRAGGLEGWRAGRQARIACRCSVMASRQASSNAYKLPSCSPPSPSPYPAPGVPGRHTPPASAAAAATPGARQTPAAAPAARQTPRGRRLHGGAGVVVVRGWVCMGPQHVTFTSVQQRWVVGGGSQWPCRPSAATWTGRTHVPGTRSPSPSS